MLKVAKGVKSRNRDIFLFNDVLLIAKMKGKSYKVYGSINLYVSALQDHEEGENPSHTFSKYSTSLPSVLSFLPLVSNLLFLSLMTEKNKAHAFSLSTLDGRKMDFCAKDKQEKQQWLMWFSSTEIRRESLRSEVPLQLFSFLTPCMLRKQ